MSPANSALSSGEPDTLSSHSISRRLWIGSSLAVLAGTAIDVGGAGGCTPTAPAATPVPTVPKAVLIRLGLNENPFGPSPSAIRAIEGQLATLSRYTGDEAAALAQQVAAIEQVPTEQVVLGEVLEPLGAYLVQEDGARKEIVYSTPGYTALADAAQSAGGAGVGVPLDARLENDLAALREHVGASTRALFVVNPHNPSGTVSDAAVFHEFVSEMARRTLVIVDEAYLEFLDDFAVRSSVRHAREGENVAVFRTLSKIHGLAGLPFGYAVLPRRLAEELRRRGVGNTRSLDRLAVAAASASLRDTSFVASVRSKVAIERARWAAILDALGVRRTEARGNFVFFETRRPHADIAAAMRSRGVDIGRPFPPLEQWARVSIGLPDENAYAQAALREVLRA
jgi:histidinol-phosphate aminotransferase